MLRAGAQLELCFRVVLLPKENVKQNSLTGKYFDHCFSVACFYAVQKHLI